MLASFTVNSVLDKVDLNPGNGVVDTGTPGEVTLRAAIMEANALPGDDTIDLPRGTYVLRLGTLAVSSNLTIVGRGASRTVIDANETDKVCYVEGDVTLNLSGVTITGGSDYTGGGIYNYYGTVSITDSNVSGNSAWYNHGGGIYNHSGTLTIANSTLSDNWAKYDGGGVYNRSGGTLTIVNSTVSGNSANFEASGGGIYNSGALAITNSTLTGNSANYGGGICNHAPSVTVTDSAFSGNSAYYGGGAIRNSGALLVTNSSLFGNSTARSGGAIYNSGALGVTNSTLSGNSAKRSGGAILNSGTAEIANSALSGNSAAYRLEAEGGAILNSGTLGMTNSNLFDNSADWGGGIYNYATLGITNSTLSGNSTYYYGGGIYNRSGTVTITDSALSGNSAGYGGGGIANHKGAVTVTASTVSGNLGTNYGGGIHNYSGTTTVSNSTLSANSANYNGGGVYNGSDGVVTITNSTLSGNSAIYSYGGGICNDLYRSSLTITNSTLSGNSAKSWGGGIYTRYTAGPVSLKNTIVARNTMNTSASDVGGTFNSQGHNLIGNTSGSSGWVASDLLNVDPLLGPLQDNGGPTFTHELLPGSPAIDAGDNSVVPDITGPYDQRGPGFPRIVNATIDIGAFESQLPPNQPPTAEAGGGATGYAGLESSPIHFDASGSSDPDDDPLQFRWDFDNDGTWDTEYSSDPTASHTWYDDYSGSVKVEVFDGEYRDTDSATVTVDNVAPDVDAGADQEVYEADTVSFSGSFTDPGTLDTHTIHWDFGDGETAEETLTPTHVYGDNGEFVVTLTVTDDDGGVGTDTLVVTVNNVAPTVELDLSGIITFSDGDAFLGRNGVEQSHAARATDPGSDDLAFVWSFGVTTTYYNNGLSPDPFPSPEINPMDVTDAASVTFTAPGVYTITVTVTDDDGDSGSASFTKIVTDGYGEAKPLGFWRHQFSDKGKHQIQDAALLAYLDVVDFVSDVFEETSREDAQAVLQPGGDDVGDTHPSNMKGKATQQALAAWLNFASGAVGWEETVPTGDAFYAAIACVEDLLLDPDSEHADYVLAKEIAVAINQMDE